MPKEEIFEKLRYGLSNYDSEATKRAAQEAVEKGISPIEAIDILTRTAREVGEKFARFEIYLPEVMLMADAFTVGLGILKEKIPKEKVPKVGRVVIGTVKGDIHDIGKNIVATMLVAAGFDVFDIGKDVTIPMFAETAEKVKADIIAASALMTTSMTIQKDLIEYFRAVGIRDKYKIMVGGGPVTQEYAEEIGADGYAPDAIKAVEVAKNLLTARAKEVTRVES